MAGGHGLPAGINRRPYIFKHIGLVNKALRVGKINLKSSSYEFVNASEPNG